MNTTTFTVTVEAACGCGFPVKRSVQAVDLDDAKRQAEVLLKHLQRDTGQRWRVKSIVEKAA